MAHWKTGQPTATAPTMLVMENMLLSLFTVLFLFRYLRTVVSIFSFNLYQPIPIREKPRYASREATVIVPTTFKSETELTHCLRCICACSPAAVLVVTAQANIHLIKHICAWRAFNRVRVLGVEKLNKCTQMIKALKEVQTEIVVFADDDVFWPDRYLDYLLAVFEDPNGNTGAGGTRQRVRRNPGFFINPWNFLGIAYLERRVWNNICTNAIDGSISTLSGRTAAYRTEILKCEALYQYLARQATDDKALTRWIYSHGWGITIQSDSRAVLETTLEDNPKYFAQCMRWARGHWRGNFTVQENESYWCSRRYWWGLYVIYVGQFQTPAALVDGLLFGVLAGATRRSEYACSAYTCFGTWILFTKIMKLLPHFVQYPQDMIWIPVSIAFSYLHGIINIYAAFTLHNTAWGSQKLEILEHARAKNEEVLPLLKNAMNEGETYREPTPDKVMVGDDYFSALPVAPVVDVRA